MELKFVSDNVDKKKGVHNLQTGSHEEMKCMCSLLAFCSRISSQS